MEERGEERGRPLGPVVAVERRRRPEPVGRREPCRRPPRARRPRSQPSPAATSRSAGRPAARRPCRSGRRGTSSRGPTGWPPSRRARRPSSTSRRPPPARPGRSARRATTSCPIATVRAPAPTVPVPPTPTHRVRCRGRSRHRPVRSTPAHDDRSIDAAGGCPSRRRVSQRDRARRRVTSRRVTARRRSSRRDEASRDVAMRRDEARFCRGAVSRQWVSRRVRRVDAPDAMVSMLDLSAETNCDCKEPETQRGSDGVNTELRKTFVRSSDHHTKRSSLEHTSRVDVDRVPTIAETGDAGHRPVAAGRCDHNMRTVKQCGCRRQGARSAAGSPRVNTDTPREVHLWQ